MKIQVLHTVRCNFFWCGSRGNLKLISRRSRDEGYLWKIVLHLSSNRALSFRGRYVLSPMVPGRLYQGIVQWRCSGPHGSGLQTAGPEPRSAVFCRGGRQPGMVWVYARCIEDRPRKRQDYCSGSPRSEHPASYLVWWGLGLADAHAVTSILSQRLLQNDEFKAVLIARIHAC